LENPSNIAARVISAQRIKNNELENKLTEMSTELEKLYTENKTLKRMHKREEVALKKMEDNDVDVNRLIRNYTEELSSFKGKIKKHQDENKRLNNTLIDREEELRVNKKKYAELKDILNDKKLLDSAELAKKLEKAERELGEYKAKCETLEKKYELSEKNHKHEIGVEIAHHKETKKNMQKVSQDLIETKVKLEEKERALDALNIYVRPNREAHAGSVAPWKMSTGSLNNLSSLNDNPLDKRKEYDRKVKEKNRNSKLSEKLDSDRRKFDDNDEITTLTNRSENTTHRSEKNLDFEKQRLFETERQRQEQDAELRQKDNDKLKKQLQERDERDRLEKTRLEANRKREPQDKDDADKKLKEKHALEELERKKRWTSSNENTVDLSANKKKEDLLAKLFSSNNDDENENNHKTFITAVAQPLVKPAASIFNSKPPLPSSNNKENFSNKNAFNSNNKDLEDMLEDSKNASSNNKENISKDLFSDANSDSSSKDLFANIIINSKNSKPAFVAKNSNKNLFNSNSSAKNLFDDIPTLGSTNANKNTNNSNTSPPSNYNSENRLKFNKNIENLHDGKPASAPRSENGDDFSETKSGKGDLLNKLFGSSNTNSNNNANNNFLQSKLNNIENFSSNNKHTKNDKDLNTQGSRVPYLPWDIPEATVDSKKPPISTKKTSLFDDEFDSPPPIINKINGTLSRPKDNNLFFTSNKNLNSNNQSYVEDIEELAL